MPVAEDVGGGRCHQGRCSLNHLDGFGTENKMGLLPASGVHGVSWVQDNSSSIRVFPTQLPLMGPGATQSASGIRRYLS